MIPLLLSEVDVSFSAVSLVRAPQNQNLFKCGEKKLEGDTETFGEILERGS